MLIITILAFILIGYGKKIRRYFEFNEVNDELDRKVKEISEQIKSDLKNPTLYFQRGILSDDLEDYLLAIADYNKAIELDETYVNAYINRGIAYFNLEGFQESLIDLNKALDLDSNNALGLYNRGIVLLSINDSDNAYSDFLKAKDLGYIKAKEVLKNNYPNR